MPIGFGMRIMPGVSIRASTRGIGVGLGPRAARLNVGTHGVGVSSGVGPFWASTGVGRSRSRGGSVQRSLEAYQRELKRAQREEEITAVAEKERQVLSVHLEEFPATQPRRVPEPEPVDRQAVLKDFTNQALSNIPWYKLSERRAAKQDGAQRAEDAIQEEERQRAKAQSDEQARSDASWHQLLGNDPQTVLAVLEEAFQDNQAPAAPINCEGDEVSLLMLYASPDLVPDRKPTWTPTGKPTLHKRSKTERNEFYAASLASNVLATVKEAFAVAPAINRVALMVVRKDESPQSARPVLSCLYCGRFERSRFKQLDWSQIDPLAKILNASDALIQRKGRTAEVAPLDLSDVPDLAAILRSAAGALGCEANIMPAAPRKRRPVGLDAESSEQKEATTPESGMKKHTISIGTDTVGETVSFSAEWLGTARVNGGKEAEGTTVHDVGMDWTYYRLPDHTYRVLIDDGNTRLLLPSNSAEALARGEPAEYGSWTLEELQNEGEYGRVFKILMEKHPEGKKRNVKDLG